MEVIEWKNLRKLGEGSYGIVFLAVLIAPEELKGSLIAVKSSKPHGLDSVRKEGTILSSFFGCKEIIQCIDFLTTIHNGCLIYNLHMEFAFCGSLRDLIKRKPLSEDQVKVYTPMLLRGLSLIHQSGVVHCDLKPDNILLFPSCKNGVEYEFKIADFGLSKTKDEEVDANIWKFKFRGTPFYMSPESIMGKIETPLDIWSLGCIVIEMITGLPVWHEIPSLEILKFKLIVSKETPPIPFGLSPLCEDFLNKCFLRDPDKRWTANMLLNHPFLSTTNHDWMQYILYPFAKIKTFFLPTFR